MNAMTDCTSLGAHHPGLCKLELLSVDALRCILAVRRAGRAGLARLYRHFQRQGRLRRRVRHRFQRRDTAPEPPPPAVWGVGRGLQRELRLHWRGQDNAQGRASVLRGE